MRKLGSFHKPPVGTPLAIDGKVVSLFVDSRGRLLLDLKLIEAGGWYFAALNFETGCIDVYLGADHESPPAEQLELFKGSEDPDTILARAGLDPDGNPLR